MKKSIFLLLTTIVASLIVAKPYNTIIIDGDISDWDKTNELCKQEPYDSEWNIWEGKNDIRKLFVTWDKNNLYIAFEVELSGAGVIVYFSYDEATGSKDLTKLNSWRRLVQFDRPVNLFFAAWEGQQGSFYKVESSTYAYDLSWYFERKFSKGIYELKLPFRVLYPYSETPVRKNAEIDIVICIVTGDMGEDAYGSYGYIVADTLPDNDVVFMSTITIRNFHRVRIDSNGDGIPDNFNFDVKNEFVRITPKVLPICQTKANLEYVPSKDGKLSVHLVDVNKGQCITKLYEGYVNADKKYDIEIDLKNFANDLTPGMYIINLRLNTADQVKIKNLPIVLLK